MQLVLEKLIGRSSRSIARLLLGSLLLISHASLAWADALDVLQGVWVDEDTDCTMVFEKIQGKVRFKSRTFATANGFIITGNKATGPVGGTCTISPSNEENGSFSAQLSCADAVVSKKFMWSFRIIDANSFERFDTLGGSAYSYKYKKCTF